MTLSPSSTALLRDVAQVIVDSGYAEPYIPRRHYIRRCKRLAQLRELSARFVALHGYEPRRCELALMAGLSPSSVTKILDGKAYG